MTTKADVVESVRNLPKTSAVALVTANLLPLFGVLILGWSAGIILFLYWLETVVVGFYNIPRILMASKGGWRNFMSKFVAIPLFCLQFGMMVFVQGLIIAVLFNPGAEGVAALAAAAESQETPTPQEEWAAYFGLVDGEELEVEQLPLVLLYTLIISGAYWALLALFISHGVSFAVNFVGKGEYLRVSTDDLAHEPFKRVALLQIAVMTGALFWMLLGRSIFVLVALIVMKIALDLAAHRQEHARMMGHDTARPLVKADARQ